MCSLISLLLDKLKSAIKSSSEVTSIILSSMVSISDIKNKFSDKLLLTDQQIVNFVRLFQIDANKFQK